MEDLLNSLHTAVRNRDLASCQSLLQSVPDSDSSGVLSIKKLINEKGKNGRSAILEAVDNPCSEIAMIELLLSHGASIHDRSTGGCSPLILASGRGDMEIVNFLLAKGASIHDKSSRGITALILASEQGHANVVELLLSNGAEIHSEDKDGFTALMIASDCGHESVVEMLLLHGAYINDQCKGGCTSLYVACQQKHINVVKLLLCKGADTSFNKNSSFEEIDSIIISILDKWPLTMAIILLQELTVYYFVDLLTLIDLYQYIGKKEYNSNSYYCHISDEDASSSMSEKASIGEDE